MSNRQWLRKAMPGSLASSVARVHPRLPMDDAIGRAVGNWVAHDQTTSWLAEPIAEPYLHQYLEEADRVGRVHGRAACVLICLPLTVVLVVLVILVLALS